MSGQTIFIIVLTALITLILMKNTDNMEFWIFGVSQIPKLAILGTMLAIGFILGYMAGRPSKKHPVGDNLPEEEEPVEETSQKKLNLSDEDRDYIS